MTVSVTEEALRASSLRFFVLCKSLFILPLMRSHRTAQGRNSLYLVKLTEISQETHSHRKRCKSPRLRPSGLYSAREGTVSVKVRWSRHGRTCRRTGCCRCRGCTGTCCSLDWSSCCSCCPCRRRVSGKEDRASTPRVDRCRLDSRSGSGFSGSKSGDRHNTHGGSSLQHTYGTAKRERQIKRDFRENDESQ